MEKFTELQIMDTISAILALQSSHYVREWMDIGEIINSLRSNGDSVKILVLEW